MGIPESKPDAASHTGDVPEIMAAVTANEPTNTSVGTSSQQEPSAGISSQQQQSAGAKPRRRKAGRRALATEATSIEQSATEATASSERPSENEDRLPGTSQRPSYAELSTSQSGRGRAVLMPAPREVLHPEMMADVTANEPTNTSVGTSTQQESYAEISSQQQQSAGAKPRRRRARRRALAMEGPYAELSTAEATATSEGPGRKQERLPGTSRRTSAAEIFTSRGGRGHAASMPAPRQVRDPEMVAAVTANEPTNTSVGTSSQREPSAGTSSQQKQSAGAIPRRRKDGGRALAMEGTSVEQSATEATASSEGPSGNEDRLPGTSQRPSYAELSTSQSGRGRAVSMPAQRVVHHSEMMADVTANEPTNTSVGTSSQQDPYAEISSQQQQSAGAKPHRRRARRRALAMEGTYTEQSTAEATATSEGLSRKQERLPGTSRQTLEAEIFTSQGGRGHAASMPEPKQVCHPEMMSAVTAIDPTNTTVGTSSQQEPSAGTSSQQQQFAGAKPRRRKAGRRALAMEGTSAEKSAAEATASSERPGRNQDSLPGTSRRPLQAELSTSQSGSGRAVSMPGPREARHPEMMGEFTASEPTNTSVGTSSQQEPCAEPCAQQQQSALAKPRRRRARRRALAMEGTSAQQPTAEATATSEGPGRKEEIQPGTSRRTSEAEIFTSRGGRERPASMPAPRQVRHPGPLSALSEFAAKFSAELLLDEPAAAPAAAAVVAADATPDAASAAPPPVAAASAAAPAAAESQLVAPFSLPELYFVLLPEVYFVPVAEVYFPVPTPSPSENTDSLPTTAEEMTARQQQNAEQHPSTWHGDSDDLVDE